MTKHLLALLLAGTLVACASAEQERDDRLARWFETCGYPIGHGLRVTPEEERALRACIAAHENAWQARSRSVWVAPVPPFPEPSVQCITIPHGDHMITRCR